MKNIAIIPARSGSKGLPDKNIKPLNGKPLVAYTIEAALESGVFDEVHLSTDSNLYADIGIKYGASVPFLRDQLTSSDSAGSWDVVKEVLKKYNLPPLQVEKLLNEPELTEAVNKLKEEQLKKENK